MKEENISRFMRDGKITVLPKKQKNKMEIFEFIYNHLKNHDYGKNYQLNPEVELEN